MKADAHRRHAESLERAIALARPDPTTSVFYGNQAGESEVQEALDLLERIRTWATT